MKLQCCVIFMILFIWFTTLQTQMGRKRYDLAFERTVTSAVPSLDYKYSDTSILFYGYAVLKFDPQFCLKHLQLTQF